MTKEILDALIALLRALVPSVVLLFAIELIAHRSFSGAVKAISDAGRLEIRSDTGRLNFYFAILILFIFLYTTLHREVVTSPTKSMQVLRPEYVCLFLIGSLAVVGFLEVKKPPSRTRRTAKDTSEPTPTSKAS